MFRYGELSGKNQLDRDATDPAAAGVAASARVRVAPRCMGRARTQYDSGRRHLWFRLVRRADRLQLLVRRIDGTRRDRRRADPARTARDAIAKRPRDLGGERRTRRGRVDFPRWYRRAAVVDRAYSAEL